MSGKGDTPRPLSVDPETYAERYARTFGRPPERQKPPQDWPQRDTLPTTDPED